jgi:hypothetical protein
MSGTTSEPAKVAEESTAIRADSPSHSHSNSTNGGPQDRSSSPTVLESSHDKQQTIGTAEDPNFLRVQHADRPETAETATTALTAETIEESSDAEQTRNILDNRVNRRSVLDTLTLPPPPAYDLFMKEFSIGIPPPTNYLPLPVPIPAPRIFSRNENNDYLTQTIIRDVNVRCGSGEVLAM